MRPFLSLASAAVLILCAACQPPVAGPEALSEEDLEAIRLLGEEAVPDRLLAEDWPGFAASFTEDAVRMPPNESLHVGRDAIAEWSARAWGPLRTLELTQTADEIDGRGDLAYARGTYTAVVEVPGVPEPITDVGKYVVILRKQAGGVWLVSTSIYNSDLPPFGAPATGEPAMQ